MNNYQRANNSSGCGTHTRRLTLMRRTFRGHVTFPLGGNCRGGRILDTALTYLRNPGTFESDCQLTCTRENLYSMVLSNRKSTLVIEGMDWQELFNIIVAVEIIDYKPEVDIQASPH